MTSPFGSATSARCCRWVMGIARVLIGLHKAIAAKCSNSRESAPRGIALNLGDDNVGAVLMAKAWGNPGSPAT